MQEGMLAAMCTPTSFSISIEAYSTTTAVRWANAGDRTAELLVARPYTPMPSIYVVSPICRGGLEKSAGHDPCAFLSRPGRLLNESGRLIDGRI